MTIVVMTLGSYRLSETYYLDVLRRFMAGKCTKAELSYIRAERAKNRSKKAVAPIRKFTRQTKNKNHDIDRT